MQKRLPGIDLLRCLGLLFVVSLHFFMYSGFYHEAQTSVSIWAADSFMWIFLGSNGIFMMLTGYLLSQKKMTSEYYLRLIPILISYTIVCLISYPIRHFVQGESGTMVDYLLMYFSYSNYAWYVEMYIGLILISPIINLGLAALKTRRDLVGFVCVMVVLTSMPNLTNLPILPDYWVGLYPLTYYMIGAVIARLKPKWSPVLCLFGVLLIGMLHGLVSVLVTDKTLTDGVYAYYGSLWEVLIDILLFTGLYHIEIPERMGKCLAWISSGCFEGYMLSRLLDTWLYDQMPQWHCPQNYIKMYLCMTIPIFIFAVIAGHMTHCISQYVWKSMQDQT